jgi:molybdopterin molybdotransferase
MKGAANSLPDRHPIDEAIAWVDAATRSLNAEEVPLRKARGRVLTQDIRAIRPIPTSDRAALDGFAVLASASLGASAYNPLQLPLIAVASGDPLPAGTDAVIPLELAETNGRACVEVIEPVAPGDNVTREGAIATNGATLVSAGTRLAAPHIGLLRSGGLSEIPVVRRPRVRMLVSRPTKGGAWEESNTPMIGAAIERDGGVIGECVAVERDRMAIRAALVDAEADIVFVIGGTGLGINDHSAAALAEAGELAIHGVALRPGETTGLGRTVSRVLVVLLPGPPAACLWSYEMFAGRAIRRLGGRSADLPYRSRQKITVRKIVSVIGMAEICAVRRGPGDTVEPMPSFAEIGLMAAVGADGFVLVPEGSEGYSQGARVTVYLYQDAEATAELQP